MMVFNNKKLLLTGLLAMIPFGVRSSFVGSCLDAGKLASTICTIANLIDCAQDVPEPIPTVAGVYGLGKSLYSAVDSPKFTLCYETLTLGNNSLWLSGLKATFALGSLGYGYIYGYQPKAPEQPTLLNKLSAVVSTLSMVKFGAALLMLRPEIKWAVSNATPACVKDAATFINDNKVVKAALLGSYIAYKVNQ